MDDKKYFSQSWAMLTHDKGWIKPILVMAAALLVPIAGFLGVQGYTLEWARLTAWGVDASPKQKNVNVGKCISSGWRGFVVSLGWGVVVGMASALISLLFSFSGNAVIYLLGSFVSLAMSFVTAFAGVIITVAQVRAAIYEKIGAGYRLDRIMDMVKRDFSGLVRVFLIQLVGSLIIGVFVFVLVMILIVAFVPVLISAGSAYDADQANMLRTIAAALPPIVIVCVLFGYVLSIVGVALNLLVTNAVGLWMRQFNVAQWGRSEDPLPQTDPYGGGAAPVQPGYTAQPQQPQQPMPQQPQQPQQPQPQQPQNAPTSQPMAQPIPKPVVQVNHDPEPTPGQESEFAPEHAPEPAPAFEEDFAPKQDIPLESEPVEDGAIESMGLESAPAAEPEPAPEPAFEPELAPEPEPVPAPEHDSAPAAEPEPAPTPEATPDAEPVSKIDPSTTAELVRPFSQQATTSLKPIEAPEPITLEPAVVEDASANEKRTSGADSLYDEAIEAIKQNDFVKEDDDEE